MPLQHVFQTSTGTTSLRECILVEIEAGGLTGWGECVAKRIPNYSYECVGTAWHILSEFAVPLLLKTRLGHPDDTITALDSIRGHRMAKAALNAAVWDLYAQARQQSLAEALNDGLAARDRVLVGVSVGIEPTVEALVEQVEGFVRAGYRRVKLKVKPGVDLDRIQAVRQAFPDIPLSIDANSAYRLSDLDHLRRFDEFGLLMIEQPLEEDDIYEHSLLQPALRTPLCLDESITTLTAARSALALGACRIINIKPSRVGGLSQARRLNAVCQAAGVPTWCGGMLETGVGRAANLALASLPNFTLPGDISATDRYYKPDVTEPFLLNTEDSTITVPRGMGLGVTVDRDRLRAVTQRTAVWQAGQD